MKAIIRSVSVILALIALTSIACATTPDGWTSDLEKAFTKAKAEKKFVLVEFTGSDWCPPCIAMRKEVFTKSKFIQAASKKFVLVELDFPNSDPAMQEKNKPYGEKYKVILLPTVILFTPEGKEFSRIQASHYPTVDLFLARIDEALEMKDLD